MPAQVLYSNGRSSDLVDRGEAQGSTARAGRRGRLPVAREGRGAARRRRQGGELLKQRVDQALSVPGVDRRVEVPVDARPEGHPGGARGQVPASCWWPTARTSSCALQEPEARRRTTRWPSAPSASTPRPGSTTSRTRRSTPPGACRTRTGPVTWPAPWCRAASPENPLKARWLGIYDGAGIHGTDQTYSLGSAASHGCIRMAIPDVIELYDQVAGRRAHLHRLSRPSTPISRSAPPPNPALQVGLAAGVSNAERADEDAALSLSQDRVPHGRGVARALDRMPGLDGGASSVDQPGLGELSRASRPARPRC